MVAKFTTKCQDRCGLKIHEGHDEIERGHFGYRHADCERAQVEAWVRARFDAGDDCCDIQFKIAKATHLDADAKMMASCYALTYADRRTPWEPVN